MSHSVRPDDPLRDVDSFEPREYSSSQHQRAQSRLGGVKRRDAARTEGEAPMRFHTMSERHTGVQ